MSLPVLDLINVGAGCDCAKHSTKPCANCGLPIAADWHARPRYGKWTHVGPWQGQRCPGALTGATQVGGGE